jgi:hypothetical protein
MGINAKNKGLIFRVEDVDTLTKEEIKNLVNSKQIKFMSRYEEMYKKLYNL